MKRVPFGSRRYTKGVPFGSRRYTKGVPFGSRRYTKGVPFLSKTEHERRKRVSGWDSGLSFPL